MDWNFAIERHRGPLLRIIAELCAMIGLTEGGVVERVSKPLYRLVLSRLRAAESAVRRLIVAAARDIVVVPSTKRIYPTGCKKSGNANDASGRRPPSFKLFDPPKRFDKRHVHRHKRPKVEPRIHYFPYDPRIPLFLRQHFTLPAPVPAAPVLEDKVDDGTVDARHLVRRLLAITDALQDIPRQALRLARWRARPVEERHPPRSSPLRVGRPPGFRQRAKHEVDEILKECHWLARNAEPQLDTS